MTINCYRSGKHMHQCLFKAQIRRPNSLHCSTLANSSSAIYLLLHTDSCIFTDQCVPAGFLIYCHVDSCQENRALSDTCKNDFSSWLLNQLAMYRPVARLSWPKAYHKLWKERTNVIYGKDITLEANIEPFHFKCTHTNTHTDKVDIESTR